MSTFAPDLFAGKRFAVVGLGKNGLPAAQALAAMGAEVVAWDDSEKSRAAVIPASSPVIPAKAGIQRSAPAYAGATERSAGKLTVRDPACGAFDFDALVLSPGIPHLLPRPHPAAERARAAGVPILCDVELLFQAVRRSGARARFAGITGTNGKSTTTALLAHILAEAGITSAAGANLGPAALSLPLLPHHGVYVLEMSSYMLERLATLRFDAAAMLNLSADHLDRHGDMAGYAAAKRHVFDRQGAGDLAVVGIDDALSAEMAESMPSAVRISGNGRAEVFALNGLLQDRAGRFRFDLRRASALPGAHNAQNAAAAVAMARFLGARDEAIERGLETYPGLPHRQQRVGEIGGIAFINDSKATNADSAARALGCHERIVWIAGGMQKEGGIVPLAEYFPRIAHALLIGRDAPGFAATLSQHGVPHDIVGTLDAAVPVALDAARKTGAPVVLLSPACASWDQFTGYDQRGDRFAALVRALAAEAR